MRLSTVHDCSDIYSKKRLNLSALSDTSSFYAFEIDFSNSCNLNCVYCYKKDKSDEHLSKKVAFDALVWVLRAAIPHKRMAIALIGGEPLLNFPLIKEWVPFAVRRTQQEGMSISISVTTNCTLISDEVVDFFKKWNLRFHTSIDGVPDVQNINRPTKTGKASATLVERGVAKILASFPNTTARSTVFPQTVNKIFESYLYLKALGYTDIAMIPSDYTDWDSTSIRTYEQQLQKIADNWMRDLRAGKRIIFKSIEDYLFSHSKKTKLVTCGGGIGMVSIDIFGNIWSCSRMTKFEQDIYCLGSIYGDFNQKNQDSIVEIQQQLMANVSSQCSECIAKGLCQTTCPAEHLECIGVLYGHHHNQCELARAQARVGDQVYQVLYAEKNPLFMKIYRINTPNELNPI